MSRRSSVRSILRPLWLLGIVFCQAATVWAADGFPLVTSYSADDIAANPMSWVVVQDNSGVLHFGARELVSFDGDRWHSTPMKGARIIRALDFSKDGRILWAGGVGEIGWFQRTTEGSWTFHSLLQSIPPEQQHLGEVWQVFAEDTGAVFVSDEKILRWNGATMQVWSLPGPGHLRGLRADGHTYVQHRLTGLHRMAPGGPELVISRQILGEKGIFWMERRGPDIFLITNEGPAKISHGQLVPGDPVATEILTTNLPTSVARLADGRFAVSTLRSGIVLLNTDGTVNRILREQDGLPTNLISYVFEDRDRQLWGTSFTHIFRISVSSASAIFDRRAALPNKPFYRLAGDATQLFAATDDSVYTYREGANQFRPFPALNEHLADLVVTERGVLAAAVHAVKRITNETVEPIYTTSYDTFVVQPEPGGQILVADGRQIIELNGRGESRLLATNLPDNAWSIAQDTRHRLWMGTETNGVLLAEPYGDTPAIPRSAAPELGRTAIPGNGIVRKTSKGDLYLLYSSAAWRLDNATDRFQPVINYPDRKLIAASASDDDSVWLVHVGGGLAPCIGRVSLDQAGRATWESHSVEGLASIGVPQTIFAQQTSRNVTILWIGGSSGILRHEVAHGLSAPQPRPPLLRAVARNSDNDAPQAITAPLPYSTRSIEFEFAEPDFTRRAALRLQTRFVGVDRDWVPADATSRQTLTAVREGRYTFQVRAVAETGVASVPTTLTFEVLPPWYRTWKAIAGGMFCLLPLGYGSYRLRIRALRRHNAELEEKVHHRTEELERASAAKTQFVANMSHDIRNPLNGIVGLTLALDDTRLEKRQREIVATLRECATYLSTLVDDVLDFASIEAGRVELRNGPFVPHELLRSIVTTVKADTAERGAVIIVEADPSLPASVLGDAGRVQQILVNYVSNALKYAGGHICLSACVPPDSPGEIEFSVADEGPGISDAEKATLFTKFNRLSRARREDIPGSGLGLAACRLLADHMGGSVGVDSEPGRGARFYLRLPLSIAPVRPEAPQDLPNTTVLVVEDTDYNAWAAAAVLAKLGLACERARTGEEALRLFRERRFNVVLLDRNLPDLDGTEVARQMRAMESDGLQAVLLAVTAYCTAEDRALCLKSGMDAFVGKPLTPEKLRKVLLATGRRQLAAASVHVSPEVPAVTALDLSLLKYLSNGSSDGLEAEIARYIARLDDCLAEITTAVDAPNLRALARAAHGLQGHAKLIGASRLAELSLQLEHAAVGQIESGLYDQLRQITAETHALKAQLHHHRSSARRA